MEGYSQPILLGGVPKRSEQKVEKKKKKKSGIRRPYLENRFRIRPKGFVLSAALAPNLTQPAASKTKRAITNLEKTHRRSEDRISHPFVQFSRSLRLQSVSYACPAARSREDPLLHNGFLLTSIEQKTQSIRVCSTISMAPPIPNAK